MELFSVAYLCAPRSTVLTGLFCVINAISVEVGALKLVSNAKFLLQLMKKTWGRAKKKKVKQLDSEWPTQCVPQSNLKSVLLRRP